ncbi:HAD hydrolase family protein [Streptomyces cacaoi]|uniref:HAD hydrolase family protein n=1 Tax=Streptomyces TaxID=1883 RepID=UPI0004CA167B|nr:HAD hydrolase family protein [Streptomyces cacaoi]
MVPVTHPSEPTARTTPAGTATVPTGTAVPTGPAAARPRLIATDLDGTLLRDDKSVSARTISALAAAEAAGIEVFFVTGRPARWMGVVSDHVHGHGLAICANGAAVVDLHSSGSGRHRIVETRPLERRDALEIVHALRAAAPGVSFAVERTGGIHYEPEYPSFPLDPGASFAPADVLLTDATDPAYAQPVLKLLAHHPTRDPDEFLALGRKVGGAHGEFTRSSHSALLEISGRGVSKASTLARACAERGITAEEVVAFGDMPNDLAMLAWAGRSYAMANAHPEVLLATTGRTLTNEEDGVATVIETFLPG